MAYRRTLRVDDLSMRSTRHGIFLLRCSKEEFESDVNGHTLNYSVCLGFPWSTVVESIVQRLDESALDAVEESCGFSVFELAAVYEVGMTTAQEVTSLE